MQANDFDALLRSRYEEYQPEYNAVAWTALVEKLPPVKSSRRNHVLWPLGLGLAASIAVACILIVHKPTLKYTMAGLPVQHSADRPPPIVTQSPISKSKVAKSIFVPVPKANIGNYPYSRSAHPFALLDAPVVSPPTPRVTAQQDLQAYDPEESKPMLSVLEKPEQTTRLEYPVFKVTEAERSGAAKTIISLTGGIQYGSLNGGYAAGIQLQHKLNSRWYAETAIGYQHYAGSGTNQLSTVDYSLISSIGQGFAGLDSTRPKLQSNQVVQYIQASPGVGYHLSNRISIGAGVDFQRVLQSSGEKTILVEGNDLKLLPLLDVGATGRISFRLSDWLEAGVLYRQGVNNILQSRQLYLVRQYLQVQLTVPLIKR